MGAIGSERWRRGLARIGRGWAGVRNVEVYERLGSLACREGRGRYWRTRLCYGEVPRLGGNGARRCGGEGGSFRGAAAPIGKRWSGSEGEAGGREALRVSRAGRVAAKDLATWSWVLLLVLAFCPCLFALSPSVISASV